MSEDDDQCADVVEIAAGLEAANIVANSGETVDEKGDDDEEQRDSAFSSLPTELIERILQYVSLDERLRNVAPGWS